MRNFISTMLKKHEHGLVHTGFLTDAADRIISLGINADDVSIMKFSFNFLKGELEKNAANEEQYIFPIFSGAMDKTKIEKMKKEHRLLKSNLSEIEEMLQSLEDNSYGTEYVFKLKESTREFSKRLKEHYTEEKDFLFIVAWKNLPENEIKNIFTRKG